MEDSFSFLKWLPGGCQFQGTGVLGHVFVLRLPPLESQEFLAELMCSTVDHDAGCTVYSQVQSHSICITNNVL